MEVEEYEKLLKQVYQTAPIGLCLFDTELRYRHINEWLASINGLSVQEHVGRTISEVIPDVSEGVESQLRRVMETGEPVLDGVVEAQTPASPHQKRTFQHSYHAVRSDDGIVVGVSCIVQEITSRKRAEDALKQAYEQVDERVQEQTAELQKTNASLHEEIAKRLQAQENYRTLLEASPDAMVIVNSHGEIVLINRQTEILFGYDRHELVGQGVDRLLPHHLRDTHVEHRTNYLHDPSTRAMGSGLELVALHKDGHELPVEVSLSPCETDDGMIVISSIRDISERRHAASVLRAHRNARQVLARKLLSAQEDERRRLARELHDDLAQRLAAIGIDSMSLETDVRAVSESCADQVAALHGRIRQISADIHQISHQLHPSILDELGLVKAMKGECDAVTRRTGISIRFVPPGEHASVETSTELVVYRIMQECLQNIVKHSRAVSGCVELAVDNESIHLNVHDTGIGFDPGDECHEHGLGMASIRERVEMLGGSVSFESETGQGVTVNVTLPRRGMTA
jgi:PAS domain S-box-containing protein